MQVVVVPGYGGSGEAHWQTLWERNDSNFQRFRPGDWLAPDLADWVAALDIAVRGCPRPPFLLGHSLGCLAIAHWAASMHELPVAGALLVAVPDPLSPMFPIPAAAFRELPCTTLPFPALVVASADDPFSSRDFAERQAAVWGAELTMLGALGHINTDSGLGQWETGKQLLHSLAAAVQDGRVPIGRAGL